MSAYEMRLKIKRNKNPRRCESCCRRGQYGMCDGIKQQHPVWVLRLY